VMGLQGVNGISVKFRANLIRALAFLQHRQPVAAPPSRMEMVWKRYGFGMAKSMAFNASLRRLASDRPSPAAGIAARRTA
jgi:hypothetical protein